jgi:GDPmannose 4,6-dehydratase
VKTAVITGVTGQDGRLLAELLLTRGYRVVGTSRVAGAALAGVERRAVDLTDDTATRVLIAEVRPDEVYHLAGQSSVGLSFQDPAGTFRSIASTTLSLLEAARTSERPFKLFVASSGEVFGETDERGANESTPFRPQSPYAAAKAAAAELAVTYRLAYGLFVCVAYLFNHESPLRSEGFVTRKVVRGACEIAYGERKSLELGELSVIRDFGWAPEYVTAFPAMLEREIAEDFVIATGVAHRLADFVDLVFASVELAAKDYVRQDSSLLRPTDIRALRADPARAAEKLGWRATTTLAEIARRLVEAEKRQLGLE